MAQVLDLHSGLLQAGAVRGGGLQLAKLDFTRITAEAGAIAINAAALLLLLAPLSAPPPAVEPLQEFVQYQRIDPPKPPELPPVVEVKQTPIHPQTPPQVQQQVESKQEIVVDPTPDATIFEQAKLVADANIGNTLKITEPLPAAHLETAFAPPPAYPLDAMRRGVTGEVLLRVLVDVDGSPISVQIERSSGNRTLDNAAKRQVESKWRFKPAVQDGQPIQAIGMVPIIFKLG
ncbi:energy transducer TonB [Lysobacter fragariae]